MFIGAAGDGRPSNPDLSGTFGSVYRCKPGGPAGRSLIGWFVFVGWRIWFAISVVIEVTSVSPSPFALTTSWNAWESVTRVFIVEVSTFIPLARVSSDWRRLTFRDPFSRGTAIASWMTAASTMGVGTYVGASIPSSGKNEAKSHRPRGMSHSNGTGTDDTGMTAAAGVTLDGVTVVWVGVLLVLAHLVHDSDLNVRYEYRLLFQMVSHSLWHLGLYMWIWRAHWFLFCFECVYEVSLWSPWWSCAINAKYWAPSDDGVGWSVSWGERAWSIRMCDQCSNEILFMLMWN